MKKELDGKGLDDKIRYKVALVLKYYIEHLANLLKDANSVFILTDSQESKRAYQDILSSELLQVTQPGKQAGQ